MQGREIIQLPCMSSRFRRHVEVTSLAGKIRATLNSLACGSRRIWCVSRHFRHRFLETDSEASKKTPALTRSMVRPPTESMADMGDTPQCAVAVLGDEQRPVVRDSHTHRTAPDAVVVHHRP